MGRFLAASSLGMACGVGGGVALAQEGHCRDYGDTGYWERRYQEDSSLFEWHGGLRDLEPWLRQVLPGKSRVLHLGCGTSGLAEELHDAGYAVEICNVDCSAACIERMRERNSEQRPQLKWLQADVMDLSSHFRAGEFDCAIDKATLDAICYGGRDAESGRYLSELQRLLAQDGELLLVSWALPVVRLPQLSVFFRCAADISQTWRGVPSYVYTCKRRV